MSGRVIVLFSFLCSLVPLTFVHRLLFAAHPIIGSVDEGEKEKKKIITPSPHIFFKPAAKPTGHRLQRVVVLLVADKVRYMGEGASL